MITLGNVLYVRNASGEFVPVMGAGGNPTSGLSGTASNLLITILRAGVYTADQSANITALETALNASGDDPVEPDEPDEPATQTHTISYELVNVISSNSVASVEENAAYSATLTASDGYTLNGGTVTVLMGGVDITATAYADGVIAIAAVTGNVEIMASAVILETEATLPEDGLLSFFDLRNLGDNMNVTIGTTKGVYATQGEGSLFSWAGTPITSSDEYGAVLPRALIFSTDRTANQADLGSEYTVMMSSYGASTQPVLNGFMSNVVAQPSVKWEPKYNTSDSTTNATAENFSLNTDGSGYRFMAVVVSGSAIRLYFDGELIVENDGSVYDGFASWVSNPTNVGTIYNAGQSVAYAAYNKALSTEEIVNAYSFFETLEVTA